ncbi:DedD protein [Silvimonas terrae]|uniref:DedD protein n=1 Tax=Silvimonas terrae TaxID=300266 RepID=A0A840RC99_9NEIS|nr:SPOR domain-containing protein [Silvimonas terrae]MBB5189980.1 DedD protein [Silvimonas terrae]
MARDNIPDELQHLRKRARRRLVGAVALVLFSLTVLWTVLDSQPPANLAAQHPVEIIASAPSAGNASAVAMSSTVTPDGTVASAAQPDGLTPATVTATPAPVVAANTAPAPVAAVKPVDGTTHAPQSLPGKLQRVQGDEAPAPKPRATPTPAPEKPAAPKPKLAEAKPTPKPKATPDPEAILNGTADSGGTPAAADKSADNTPRHYVQLGAFGNADKAHEVVGKLKAAGLPAYSEKVTTSTGTLTRVRVGPVVSSEAYNVAKKLSSMGYQGQVVSK